MGIFDMFNSEKRKAEKIGTAKALRDVDLAGKFLKEHNGNPPMALATKFFAELGSDVDDDSEHEVGTYRKLTREYQINYSKSRSYDIADEFAKPSPGVELKVLSIPFDENTTPEDILKMVLRATGGDQEMTAEIMEAVIGQAQEQFAANLEAGYFLGCGGGMSENGGCLVDGDDDWDGTPENAKGNTSNKAKAVSETERFTLKLAGMTTPEKLNYITALRSRMDQLKASHKEAGGFTREEEDELDRISAQMDALADDAGIPRMEP